MLDKEKVRKYTRRLLEARMRILNSHGFFGMLLMNIGYGLDENMETAATNGEKIVFSPDFMDSLNDKELDFVMMHEILHVALQHCLRGSKWDARAFNIACDIVVNSNIMKANGNDKSSITLREWGESMHLVPDGKEGWNYTAEEVYDMLPKSKKSSSGNGQGNEENSTDNASLSKTNSSASEDKGAGCVGWDDHSKWGSVKDEDGSLADTWANRVRDAAAAIEIINSTSGRGTLPLCVDRMLKEMRDATLDWKTMLNNFLREEICDYSFSPPDRRFDETGFYLPDFNETDFFAEDILFMIDTSGSMSDKDISDAYSEIKGAIDQFGGKLKGWLGFFDAAVVDPVPFMSEDEFRLIKAKGGGGTRFDIIFKYVREKMSDRLPKSIVILTDGFAPMPEEREAADIPVLWIVNNDRVEIPWGRCARIKRSGT